MHVSIGARMYLQHNKTFLRRFEILNFCVLKSDKQLLHEVFDNTLEAPPKHFFTEGDSGNTAEEDRE